MLSVLSIELFKMPGLFLTVGVILIGIAVVFFIVGMGKAKQIQPDDKTPEEETKSESTLVTDKVIAKPVVIDRDGGKLEINTPVVPVAVKKEEPVEEKKEEVKVEPLVLNSAATVEVKKVETPEVKVE